MNKEINTHEHKSETHTHTAHAFFIAAIRIRGETGVKGDIQDTMHMLHLSTKHTCVIMPKTPVVDGMLKKAKDYITWGEISPETITLLKEKRGSMPDATIFRLSPPRGGFERKGIKVAFRAGGALGYRGDKMNGLIRKMI